VGGFFGDGRGMRIQTQELAALGSHGFGGVGEKVEVANSHKPAWKDMKQESTDELLDWEFSDLELIPVFSIAVPPEADQPRAESEGDLPIVD